MKKLNSLSNHQKYVYAYSALIRILHIDAFSEDKKEFVRNMNKVTTNFDAYIHNLEVLLRQLKIPCRNLKKNLLTEACDFETDDESEYVYNVLNKLYERYPFEWRSDRIDVDLADFR